MILKRSIIHYTLLFLREDISTANEIDFFSLDTYPRCQPVSVLQATITPVNLSIAQSLLSITIHI